MGHPPNLYKCSADPNPWIDKSRQSNSVLPRWVTCAQVQYLSSTMFAATPDAAASPRRHSNMVRTIRSASSGMEKARPSLSASKTWRKFKPSWTIIGGCASWWTSGLPCRRRSQACEFKSSGRLPTLKKPGGNPELLRKPRIDAQNPNAIHPVNYPP